MISRNNTPFAAIGFGQIHRDGPRMAVICVRGAFIICANGELHISKTQNNALSDVYESRSHRSPLVRVTDLIPYKPFTDVTVLGAAHAPGGRPALSWDIAVAIGDHRVSLLAHGPRVWEPTLRFLKPSWKLATAGAATRVPVDYRLAAGGKLIGDPDDACDLRNPIGPGILTKHSRFGIAISAPQIDSARSQVLDPFATPTPRGFGPIPPSWAWRDKFAGTRDETWQRERLPYLPHDFDYRFYQTAHADLVLPNLGGDERVHLIGMVPGGGELIFQLPNMVPIAEHDWFDGRRVTARLRLDGVHLDLRADDGPWHLDLTWRGWITLCPAYDSAALSICSLKDAADLPTSGEQGLAVAA